MEQEQAQHAGNNRADTIAKKAAGVSPVQAWISTMQGSIDELCFRTVFLAKMLCRQSWTKIAGLERCTIGKERLPSTATSHTTQWSSSKRKWTCTTCGMSTRHTSKISTKCLPTKWLQGIPDGHRIVLGNLEGGGRILVCFRCGQHRTSGSNGLRKNCGANRISAKRLSRLRECMHPVTSIRFNLVCGVETQNGANDGVFHPTSTESMPSKQGEVHIRQATSTIEAEPTAKRIRNSKSSRSGLQDPHGTSNTQELMSPHEGVQQASTRLDANTELSP